MQTCETLSEAVGDVAVIWAARERSAQERVS